MNHQNDSQLTSTGAPRWMLAHYISPKAYADVQLSGNIASTPLDDFPSAQKAFFPIERVRREQEKSV